MKRLLSSPAKIFLTITVVLTASIYMLCDFYLNTLGRELMLNWAKTESAAIQEGNLLTAVTKSQPYMMASNYVQGIQLIKKDDLNSPAIITFGERFEIAPAELSNMPEQIFIQRVGFLHSRAYLKVPGANEFVMVLDLNSRILDSVFFSSVSILVLILIGIISALRHIERQEASCRERLLKLAIHDLVANDQQSEILAGEFPEFAKWWILKKNEIQDIQRLAAEAHSKIILGETASRLVHDIKGPLRNIQILVKRMTGLDAKAQDHLYGSIQKISAITRDFSNKTKRVLEGEVSRRLRTPVETIVEKVLAEKKSQHGQRVTFSFHSDLSPEVHWYVDPLELERSFANLIDNAVEASQIRGSVEVHLSKAGQSGLLTIRDSGCGVSEAESSKIGIKGFTQKVDGSGLGVFYAKKMTEDAGGRFDFDSTAGAGTTVSICFPIAVSELEAIDLSQILDSPRIVIVDDSEFVLEATKSRLLSLVRVDRPSPPIVLLKSPDEFRTWKSSIGDDNSFYSLIDYHYEGTRETGANLIESEKLMGRSFIYTSAPDDPLVIQQALRLGVPVIAKDGVLIG
jgi:signal transduction histidine kinase